MCIRDRYIPSTGFDEKASDMMEARNHNPKTENILFRSTAKELGLATFDKINIEEKTNRNKLRAKTRGIITRSNVDFEKITGSSKAKKPMRIIKK